MSADSESRPRESLSAAGIITAIMIIIMVIPTPSHAEAATGSAAGRDQRAMGRIALRSEH